MRFTRLFHFWKNVTGGRHLWLRNNASTMTSQIVDTTAVILITHFYASGEGRQAMANHAITEILTLNTLPTVLNRDVQGRLRKKMVVLKIERWLAGRLCEILGLPEPSTDSSYQIDMSSKNPRFIRKIHSNEELPDLRQNALF